MSSYALLMILPLLQIASIVILVKKFRGSMAMLFGVLAVGCWMLSGLASIFLRPVAAVDMATTGTILFLLNFAGWISFIVMIIILPVGKMSSGAGLTAETAAESPGKTDSQRTGSDLVYRFGKIGALAGFVIYMIIAGIDRLSEGDILMGAVWGFISGFIGGGAGATLGFFLEKRR